MIHYQNKATIDFFGPVDMENIDLEGFAKELNKVQGQELEILINSPGGDIFDGVAIADLIQRREAHTTTTAIGLAASIATVVPLPCPLATCDLPLVDFHASCLLMPSRTVI